MQTTHGDKFTIQTMYCLCRQLTKQGSIWNME